MAARTAGQRGYIPISTNLVPFSTVARQWEVYCEGAAEGGQPPPDRANWRVSRSIYVGDSTQEARQHCLNGSFARSYGYLIKVLTSLNMLPLMKRDLEMPDEAVTPEYCMDELAIVGDVDECTRQLNELYEVSGGFGTLLMIAQDWDDKGKWHQSIERLAKDVVPQLPKG